MKESTLHTLITARTLLDQAERDCAQGDRYKATAGLIVLQDAVELVFYAALVEKGVDEQIALENLSFDQMIGSLNKAGVKVPKSVTLKAMNKLRVTAKHYGQLMEPTTVQGHMSAAKAAVDSVLQSVIGKPLREIFLAELIAQGEPRTYLELAALSLSQNNYMECLLATRKAFFLTFEKSYCIDEYRDTHAGANRQIGLFGLSPAGYKAPYATRNAQWIFNYVKSPSQYIQIDYDRWRMEAIEWGINTQTLANIQRLTPKVMRFHDQTEWFAEYPGSFIENCANHENAAMCLDLTIEAIRRQQEHWRGARLASFGRPYDMPRAYVGQPLFERSDTQSPIILELSEDHQYSVMNVLDGLESGKKFYYIHCSSPEKPFQFGYIELLEEKLPGAEPESSEALVAPALM